MMKRMIYGIALTASITGVYADYCPDTLTQDQMELLAAEKLPYACKKALNGGVMFGGRSMIFTASSEADRKVIQEALLKTSMAHKESEMVPVNPRIVTCHYQCRDGYWKFKISAPIH